MSYIYDIKCCKNNMPKKIENYDESIQELAAFAKVLSHPARLEILRYLASCKTCISGDITDKIPLSRSTVSQHLKELKKSELIQGSIDGVKICYCINNEVAQRCIEVFDKFFNNKINCCK